MRTVVFYININKVSMGLIEKLGKYVQKKGNSHLSLNACMLGARGVGKTSVLAAIFNNSRSLEGFAGTSIKLQAKEETKRNLEVLKDYLSDAFTYRRDIAAIPASKGEEPFYFEIGLIDNAPCVDLIVTDYPGEKLISEPNYVSKKIEESEIVIIAIDTPYFMEQNAVYNEEKNQVTLTTKFITENIDSFENKLVMLVPLKCEKYLDLYSGNKRNDRSEEMTEKIISIYDTMIKILEKKDNVAVVIAPILTVGGVTFDKFELVENLHVAKYRFYDGITSDGSQAKYSPKFCAQPIFYLLSFVAHKYKRYRNSVGLFGAMFKTFSDFFNNNEKFLLEMVKIDKLRIKEGNGYKILCGEELFYSKND